MELTREHAGKQVMLLNAAVTVPLADTEEEAAACDAWLALFNPAYADKTYETEIDDHKMLLVKAFYDATIFGADRPYPDVSGLPIETRQKFYDDTLALWNRLFSLTEEERIEFEAELKKELLLN